MHSLSRYRSDKFVFFFFLLLTVGLNSNLALAQQTNNSSSLTNSAAPSASSVTTGGTNINYQTNNTFQNEFGFAPGIYCRTPSLYVGGSWGKANLDAFDPIQTSGNQNNSYSANAGLVIPFGSQVLDYCKQLAYSIARDREISSQLSMLRTCRDLEKEGLVVDPIKFPLLKPCVKDPNKSSVSTSNDSNQQRLNSIRQQDKLPNLKPVTTRVL
jgi:hypothetical protein